MLGELLENVRKTTPLVHSITNYVTSNDCANALLAVGASPVMADDIDDIRDITPKSASLNINIGTLHKETVKSMTEAGRISNRLRNPVILDPVGSGASALRTETAKELMREIKFSAVKGNISEIKSLTSGISTPKGVDAGLSDSLTDKTIRFAEEFSESTGAIIIITGKNDLVTDSRNTYIVHNGHPMMSKVTGTGCMLSAVTAAFMGANKDCPFMACLAAVCAFGLCGETAFSRLKERDGNASYRNYIIDELYNLSPKNLEEGAKYEVR